MKKAHIINLIKYYSEKNDEGFKREAYLIAEEFSKNGEVSIAQYIMGILSQKNVWIPQENNNHFGFVKKVELKTESLPLPKAISNEVMGIINAVSKNLGVNKFLFQGDPGTGKTETSKQIARILNRELFKVDFNTLISSKLGETNKNISSLFNEINNLNNPENVVILFDELDAIALDRLNNSDIREMGRATSEILKCLDELNENVLLIATTNLYKHFDKALLRRFDKIIDFNSYTREDLLEVAESILDSILVRFPDLGSDKKLFKKILKLYQKIPYPGELKNLIRSSIAFSDYQQKFDYLKKIYTNVTGDYLIDVGNLLKNKFTVREVEVLTGISRSSISRGVKAKNE
ncbi:ATP-binding protein [Mycoplasmopsis sturni]|uniref:ATP-binding protein n=1 Tax=Mycoplasmopsis sturni TaxID=39047 RepID=UPI0005608EB5|nr:ATP-binding protein [Mycoplasmopsis sturni]